VSLGAFVLALLSKESAVTLPGLLLVWALLWPAGRKRKDAALATLPFWGAALLYAAYQYLSVTAGETKAFAMRASALDAFARVELVGRTLLVYMGALWAPLQHSAWRLLAIPQKGSLAHAAIFVVLAAVLAGMAAACVWKRARGEYGFWWLLLSMAPASNLVAYNTRRPLAEQRMYLPSVGYALLLAAAAAHLGARLTRGRARGGRGPEEARHRRLLAAAPNVLCGVLVVSFIMVSWRATGAWGSPVRFWSATTRNTVRALADRHNLRFGKGKTFEDPEAMIHYNLGVVYGHRGRDAQAIEEYLRALALGTGIADVEVSLNLGGALLREGRHDEAMESLRYALKLEPENPWAHLKLGCAYAELKQYDKALAHFQDARKRYGEWHHGKDWSAAVLDIANAFREQGKRDEAIQAYKDAIRISLDPGPAHAGLARMYADQGRLAPAVVEYEAALRHTPASGLLHYDAGLTYERLHMFGKAAEHYRAAVAAGLDDGFTLARLGNARAQVGDFADAMKWHRLALARSPHFADARRALAVDLLRLDRAAEAQVLLERVLRERPSDAEAHTAMGSALLTQGMEREAAASYETALALAPGALEACANLGRIYARSPKKRERGVMLLRQAVRMTPDHAGLRADLARALDVLGKSDDALSAWREALRLDPRNEEARKRIKTND